MYTFATYMYVVYGIGVYLINVTCVTLCVCMESIGVSLGD